VSGGVLTEFDPTGLSDGYYRLTAVDDFGNATFDFNTAIQVDDTAPDWNIGTDQFYFTSSSTYGDNSGNQGADSLRVEVDAFAQILNYSSQPVYELLIDLYLVKDDQSVDSLASFDTMSTNVLATDQILWTTNSATINTSSLDAGTYNLYFSDMALNLGLAEQQFVIA